MKPLVQYLQKLINLVDNVPVVIQPARFGNVGYNNWLDAVKCNITQDLCLWQGCDPYLPELISYFLDSLGSYERRDYGTGHELNFFVFLFCL